VELDQSPSVLGKPQDGIVSRFLNRPISRSITRYLLRFPITPNVWTLSIFPLLIVAFGFLLRGDHAGFVIALAIFQIYSILDGCDGEIARAKNLVSERGRLLDTFCDLLGNLLLVIGLGFGLQTQYRVAHYGWFYPLEGIVAALLITANEFLLHTSTMNQASSADGVNAILYPRHRGLVQRSGLLFLGAKTVWWLMQFTKRDVAILLFLVLAVAGFSQWILHLSAVVGAVSLLLSTIAWLNPGPTRRGMMPPGSRP